MIYFNRFVILTTGISLIALSGCSPRASVTNAYRTTPQPLAQTASVTSSINNQPLYQGSISSQNLATPMSPIASTPIGLSDNLATGSIAPQASMQPVTNTLYPQNTTASVAKTQYTVQAGDTIYSIARKFNIHPSQITTHNTLLNPNNLVVGQAFTIPVNNSGNTNAMQSMQKYVPPFPKTPAVNNISRSYTVQSGDTLYSIGRKFNINPNYIISKNPAINPNYLAPGQVLNIVSNDNIPKNQSTKTVTVAEKPKTTSEQPTQNASKNIMGATVSAVSSNDDNLEKQILSNALSLPVKGSIKENKNLRGVLISAADGDAVKASASGEVIYVGNLNNYGNMILVKHDNGLVTNYARLKKTFVQKGQKVNKGDLIASAGISKEFDTSDVLFEVRKGTKAVNPLDYIG